MKSIITPLLKYEMAERIREDILSVQANTYVAIGRPIRWGNDDTETANEIENAAFTINYQNQIFRDMVAMKKVQTADIALVVPRVDWTTGTKYDQFLDHVEMFSFTDYTTIGNVSVSSGQTQVSNVDTGSIFSTLAAGDIVEIEGVQKEIINVSSGSGKLNVNSAYTTTFTSNVMLKVSNTYPNFANTFYVRNSKDQVFKCLFNNNVVSTSEPTIDIDGQLPENPFIITGDGYKWKYLYTIPYGMKQKFFTTTWMPVVSDTAVTATAVDGRLDIVNIINNGTGYYTIGQSGNSASLPIIVVTGDGTGANITAKIESGVITDLNILDGGSGYTTANITAVDPDQSATGVDAVFDPVIGPKNGHGSDPSRELGCYSVMSCVELSGTENGLIPVSNTQSDIFDFRQISLVRDPLLSNGSYATASVYRMTTKVTVTDPGASNFLNDETVYIGSTLQGAGFTAIVVYWDTTNNILYLNNIAGTCTSGQQLTGANSAAVATVLTVDEPSVEMFTGDILYIENRSKIIRDNDQTEQIRLTFSF